METNKYLNVILKCYYNNEVVFLKYRNVNKLNSLFQLLENRGYKIDFVNLYNAKTKEKIDSYSYV